MKTTPIPVPLEGEQILATTPRLAPEVAAGWRRRLNFWTGRSLTADALDTEQDHRSGRLASLGVQKTPGIVHGLGISLSADAEPLAAPTLVGASIRVAPGLGLDARGEQVVVPREVQVALADIPWAFFRPSGTPNVFNRTDPSLEFVLGANPIPAQLTIGDPPAPVDILPWVAVLVLQPAEAVVIHNRPEDGPCAIDPQADAFADPRRVECARFRLCLLPSTWLPALSAAGAANHTATWRNSVAYRLFAHEASRRRKLVGGTGSTPGTGPASWDSLAGQPPWESLGVPLGLLSFEPHFDDANRFRLFLDRSTVVRPGGWPFPRPRPGIAADGGAPALWYARVRQFAEHLSDLRRLAPQLDAASIARHFRFLPPAGLLQREALDVLPTEEARLYARWFSAASGDRAGQSDFFPANWYAPDVAFVTAAPIPREELESALAASASLAPYALASPDPEPVRILVPVPQREFDPDLLVVQEPDDRVRRELERLIDVRQDWLGRRGKIRERHNAVLKLVTGQSIKYLPASTDPERTDDDELRPPSLGNALGLVYQSPAELRELSTFLIALAEGEPNIPTVASNSIPDLYFYTDRETPPSAIRVVFERLETVNVDEVPVQQVAETRAFSWYARGLLPPWNTPVDEEFHVGPVPAPGAWRVGNVGLANNGLTPMQFHRLRYEVWRGRIAVMVPALRVSRPGNQLAIHAVTPVPDDWPAVTDGALEAPMEESYRPVFPDDSTLDSRIEELESAWAYRSSLRLPDITNFTALAQTLRAPATPATRSFRLRLASDTVAALAQFPGAGAVSNTLQQFLLRDFNRFIAGPAFYQPDDFAGVNLRAETRQLLDPPPRGEARRRLHRLLIEDTFPTSFTRTSFLSSTLPAVDVDGIDVVLQTLETEANQADDFVDLNFTRAQTNLYRVRKLVLGQSAAQKLLINPAIATIAEQETATASADQLTAFVASAARGTRISGRDLNTVLSRPLAGPVGGQVPNVRPLTDLSTVRLTVKATTPATLAKTAIVDRLPETGPVLPPRGLTVGARLTEPPSTLGLRHARAGLAQLLADLPKLSLRLVGETVTPLNGGAAVELLRLQGFEPATGEPLDAAARDELVLRLVTPRALPDNDQFDEADVSWAALDLTEIKTAILRGIERVVQQRRALVARGQETRAIVASTLTAVAGRLGVLEAKVAEARHDVKVARALWQEEQERTARINRRRDDVLARVKFLAFTRPREIDPALRDTATAPLDLAEALPPVPACLRRHTEAPEELSDYLRLFQHAPARWFVDLAPRLKEIDTPDKCRRLLESAKARAHRYAEDSAPSPVMARTQSAIAVTYQGRSQVLERKRLATARLELAAGGQVDWKRQQELASEHATLGDLIENRHGHARLAQDASRQIEHLRAVATCLHAEFALVTPALRLAWTQRFSQFDRDAKLHRLTNLPRWGELERSTRRRFQEFVSYLFARVQVHEPEAFDLMNDLVRLTLLLASHAPVHQLIAGHVPRPTPATVGSLVVVKPFDPHLVRAGMEVTVWGKQRVSGRLEPVVVAHARVEDIRGPDTAIRLHQLGSQFTQLTPDMQIQFVAPRSPGPALK